VSEWAPKDKWGNLLATFLFTLTVIASSGQTIHFEEVMRGDAMFSGLVFDINQDHEGHIWFTGSGGTRRYSGYSHKQYTNRNNPEVRTDVLYGSHVDHHGKMWTYAVTGVINRLEGDTFRWLKPKELDKVPRHKRRIINHIQLDSTDTLRVSLTSAVPQIRIGPDSVVQTGEIPEKGNMTFFIESEGDYLNYYKKISGSNSDSIILEVNGGRLAVDCQEFPPGSSSGYRAIKTRQNNYVLVTGRHLIHFNDAGVLDHLVLPYDINNALLEDSYGDIWVGSYGLWRFQNSVFDLEKAAHFFEKEIVYCVFEDHEKGLWVSCAYEGVFYAPNTRVSHYTVKMFEDGAMHSMLADDEDILIGTHQAELFRVNPKKGIEKLAELTIEDALIRSIAKAPDGSIWFSTAKGVYELEDGEAVLRVEGRYRMSIDDHGDLWLGTNTGFRKRSTDAELLIDSRDLDFDHSVWQIFHGRDDTTWVTCSGRGVYAFKEDSIELLDLGPRQENGMPYLPWIIEEKKGSMLFVTNYGGLRLYQERTEIDLSGCYFKAKDANQVLWGSRHQNKLWLSSDDQISCVELNESGTGCVSARDYDASDGFAGKRFTHMHANDERLVVLNNSGLFIAPYDALEGNKHPAPVKLVSLQIGTEDTLLQQHYDLNYDQNFLTIGFEGMSYKTAGNLDFKYKLEGIDQDWVVRKTPNVQYTTLPPGDYTFSVYAANNDGIWSSEPATMSFSIAPPYWQTWWFRGGVGALFIALIWGGFAYRYRNLRMQLSLREQSLEAEQKALRAQMTPHFMFNALNSIQLLISDNERVFALKNVSKFARLMRKVLQSSDRAFIPVSEEIESLSLYLDLESLRFEGRFTFHIDTSELKDSEQWRIPPMLIQPFVENSIWHGIMKKKPQEGHVSIQFREVNGLLRCSITDDGIGRAGAAKIKDVRLEGQSSKGMSITRQRVETINKQYKTDIRLRIVDLYSDSGEANGTRVELDFPMI